VAEDGSVGVDQNPYMCRFFWHSLEKMAQLFAQLSGAFVPNAIYLVVVVVSSICIYRGTVKKAQTKFGKKVAQFGTPLLQGKRGFGRP
jgi:hypothetical protein